VSGLSAGVSDLPVGVFYLLADDFDLPNGGFNLSNCGFNLRAIGFELHCGFDLRAGDLSFRNFLPTAEGDHFFGSLVSPKGLDFGPFTLAVEDLF
jgi:hypothetical protein